MKIDRNNPAHMNYIGQLEDMVDDTVCYLPIEDTLDFRVIHSALTMIVRRESFNADLLFGEIAHTEHANDLQERVTAIEELVNEAGQYVRADFTSAENTEIVRQIFLDQIKLRAADLTSEETRTRWAEARTVRRQQHEQYLQAVSGHEPPAQGSDAHVLSEQEWHAGLQEQFQQERREPRREWEELEDQLPLLSEQELLLEQDWHAGLQEQFQRERRERLSQIENAARSVQYILRYLPPSIEEYPSEEFFERNGVRSASPSPDTHILGPEWQELVFGRVIGLAPDPSLWRGVCIATRLRHAGRADLFPRFVQELQVYARLLFEEHRQLHSLLDENQPQHAPIDDHEIPVQHVVRIDVSEIPVQQVLIDDLDEPD